MMNRNQSLLVGVFLVLIAFASRYGTTAFAAEGASTADRRSHQHAVAHGDTGTNLGCHRDAASDADAGADRDAASQLW